MADYGWARKTTLKDIADKVWDADVPLRRLENPQEISFEDWSKQYGVENPDDPRHVYDYRAAYKAGTVPTKWDDLPEQDREEDINQAISGQRTGEPMSKEDATKYYSGHYMWPDTFKREGHRIPPKTIAARNNNPGNLKFAGQPGASEGEGGFARFDTMQSGFNALGRQIEVDKGRGHTLGSFIQKYAPPSENDTEAYTAAVEKMTGVSREERLSYIPTDALANAITSVETGGLPGGKIKGYNRKNQRSLGELVDAILDQHPDASLGRYISGAWHEALNGLRQQWVGMKAQIENQMDPDELAKLQDYGSQFATPMAQAELAQRLSKVPEAERPQAAAAFWEEEKKKQADTLQAAIDLPQFKLPKEFEGKSSGYWEDAFRGAGQSLPMMGAALTSPYQMYYQVLGGKYEEYAGKGYDPKKAFIAAALDSAVQAPLEQAGSLLELGPLTRMFRGAGITKKMMSFIYALVQTSAAEGTEEYLQQYPDEIADIYMENPDISTEELVKKVKERLPEIHRRAVRAGGVGAGAGLVIAGAGAGANVGIGASQALTAQKKIDYDALVDLRDQGELRIKEQTAKTVIDKVRADLDTGKITIDQVESLRNNPQSQQLGIVDGLNTIIIDHYSSQPLSGPMTAEEVYGAESAGGGPKEGGEQAVPEGGAPQEEGAVNQGGEGGVRVRDTEEHGVGTEPGAGLAEPAQGEMFPPEQVKAKEQPAEQPPPQPTAKESAKQAIEEIVNGPIVEPEEEPAPPAVPEEETPAEAVTAPPAGPETAPVPARRTGPTSETAARKPLPFPEAEKPKGDLEAGPAINKLFRYAEGIWDNLNKRRIWASRARLMSGIIVAQAAGVQVEHTEQEHEGGPEHWDITYDGKTYELSRQADGSTSWKEITKTEEAPAEEQKGVTQRIQEAYEKLKEKGGYSNVEISELQKESGVSLTDLHRYIREQAAAGGAVTSAGDWSVSSEDVRAAAMTFPEVERPQLLVRFKEAPATAEEPEPVEIVEELGGAPAEKSAADIISDHGLKVAEATTKNGKRVWEVSGNTREKLEAIKAIKVGGQRGMWYGAKKVWTFYKGDPTEALAAELAKEGPKLPVGGGQPPEGTTAPTPADEAKAETGSEVRLEPPKVGERVKLKTGGIGTIESAREIDQETSRRYWGGNRYGYTLSNVSGMRASDRHNIKDSDIAFIKRADKGTFGTWVPYQPTPHAPEGKTGFGEPGNLNVQKLGHELSAAIAAGTTEGWNKTYFQEWIANKLGITRSALVNDPKYLHKQAEEAFELGIILHARGYIEKARFQGKPAQEIYNYLKKLYQNQPNLATRTGTSIQNQAYSTPVHLAYLMGEMIGVTSKDAVYEPTAGNGMLLVRVPDAAKVRANEIDNTRAQNLREQGYTVTMVDGKTAVGNERGKVLNKKSETVILANPPFGAMDTETIDGHKISKLEHAIIMNALDAMTDNGRAAFIIGQHNYENGKQLGNQKVFLNWLYHHYNVVANIDIPGDEYSRQGTSFPVRLFVIEGRKETPAGWPPQEPSGFQAVKSVDDIVPVIEEIRDGKTPTSLAAKGANAVRGGEKGAGGPGPGGSEGGRGELPSVPQGEGQEPTGKLGEPGAGPRGVPGGGPEGTEQGGAGGRPVVTPAVGERPAQPGALPEGEGVPGGGEGKPVSPGGKKPSGAETVSGGTEGVGPHGVPGTNDLTTVSGDDLLAILDQETTPTPAPAQSSKGLTEVSRDDLLDILDNVAEKAQPEEEVEWIPVGFRWTDEGLRYTVEKKLVQKEKKPTPKAPPKAPPPKAPEKKPGEMTAADRLKRIAENAKRINAILGNKGALTEEQIDATKWELIQPVIKEMWDDCVALAKTPVEFVRETMALLGQEAKGYFQHWIKTEFPKLQEEARKAAEPKAETTEYQTAYVPKSKGPIVDETLMPRKMAEAVTEALDNLEREVGDIDDYVREKVGYRDNKKLYQVLSADQIDAVALTINNLEKGVGMIVGDQTGVGKGRVAAAIWKYASKQGVKPVFFTEKPNLFTDFNRDITDIGHSFSPYIMASNVRLATIYDSDGNVVQVPLNPKDRATTLKSMKNVGLPALSDYDGVVTTYSQINKKGNRQQAALEPIMKNNQVILDECHNAAGVDSNTGLWMRQRLGEVRGVLYMSATFAKRPNTMPLYFRTGMSQANLTMDQLVGAIENGGVALQEIMSNALARLGQYVRREKSFKGIAVKTYVDTANRERDEKRSNEMTSILRDILTFDNMVGAVLAGIQGQATGGPAEVGGVTIDGPATVEGGQQVTASVTGSNFASVVHNAVRQLLFAMKADLAVDKAVAELKAGRKPVIAVSNTMESFLDDMIDQGKIAVGDRFDIPFSMVLDKLLRRCLTFTVTQPTGDKVKGELAPEELPPHVFEIFERIGKDITKASKDIPGSPIDYIKMKITERASKELGRPVVMDEMTGRDLVGDYSDMSNPVLRKRSAKEKANRNKIVRGFNYGDIDGLVINAAGATGLSAHAAPNFKDKRPRSYLGVQGELNVDTEVQKMGRINRKGQVVLPSYESLYLDIPAEIRPAAVLQRKLKSLSANTSANADSPFSKTAHDIPDMLNKYGDEVVGRWLHENQRLAHAMHLHEDVSMLKASGRVAIQSVDVQRRFYEEVEGEYNEAIAEAKEQGRYDLEVEDVDYKAQVMEKVLLTKGKNEDNPFGSSTYREKLEVESPRKPFKLAKIRSMVDEFLDGRNAEDVNDELVAKLESEAQTYVEAKNSEEESENVAKNRAGSVSRQVQAVKDILEYQRVKVGEGYQISLLGANRVDMNGILIGIRQAKGTGSPVAPSRIKLIFAVNNGMQRFTVPLSRIEKREIALFKMNRPDVAEWDDQARGTFKETVYMITGNLLQGYADAGSGSRIVRFTDSEGKVREGIQLPRSYNPAKSHQDVRITADQATQIVQAGHSISGPEVDIVSDRYDTTIKVPRGKKAGLKYFGDETLKGYTQSGEFETRGNRMQATLQYDKVADAIRRVYEIGETFSVTRLRFNEVFGSDEGATGVAKKPQYAVRPHREQLTDHVSLDDVRAIFKGQHVGLNEDGSIWVQTRGGHGLTIRSVEHIDVNQADVEAAYGRQLGPGDIVQGVQEGNEIKLHRLFGDKWMLAHESMHWLEDSGILSRMDVEILKAHIKKLVAAGRFQAVNQRDIGGSEDRANFLADQLTGEPQKGVIGKIIARVQEWISRLVNLIHRTPGGIVRDIQRGEIFNREDMNQFAVPAGNLSIRDALADVWDNPRFRDWFGRGQLRDAGGRPEILFHSSYTSFDTFYPWTHLGTVSAANERLTEKGKDRALEIAEKRVASKFNAGESIWYDEVYDDLANLTRSPEIQREAKEGAAIYPVVSNLRNPLRLKDVGSWDVPRTVLNELDRVGLLNADEVEQIDRLIREGNGNVGIGQVFDRIAHILEDKGYDGIVYKNTYDNAVERNGDSYIAFYPEQVKSVFNRGSFNQFDPRMSYSVTTVGKEWADAYLKEALGETEASSPKVEQARKEFDTNFVTEGLGAARDLIGRIRDKAEGNKASRWKEERPDTKILERILFTPEHYFEKVPAAQRMYEAAARKQDNFYLNLDNLTTDKGRSLFEAMQVLQKNNTEEYGRLKDLIVNADRNKVVYTEADLRAKGFSDVAVQAWSDYRIEMDKGFDILSQGMQELLQRYKDAGIAPPKIAVKIEGKKVKVSLKTALKLMGDMRGYYAPRIRRGGRFKMVAKKEGTNPIMQFFDTKLNANHEADRLERQGYTVELEKNKNLPEDVFQMAGQVVGMEAIINKALEKIEREGGNENVTMEDLGLTGKWEGTSYVVRGPWNVSQSQAFKSLGGKFYAPTGGDRAWRFDNAPKDMEKRVTTLLAEVEAASPDTTAIFASMLATEVANVIKGRGFRSAMIKRGEETGTDVWTGYEEDPLKNAALYARGLAAGTAKKQMVLEMVQSMTGTDVHWKDFPDYKAYLKEVRARRIDPGAQKNIYHDALTFFNDMRRNEEASDRAIGVLKGLATMKYLGWRVAAPIVNLTALVTSVPAAMEGYGKIPIHKTFGYIAQASELYRQYIWGDRSKMDSDVVRAFDEIRKRGWDKPQFNKETLAILQSKVGDGWSRMIETSMYMFQKTEQLNRASTIAGSYLALRKQGKSFNESLELAKKISDKAHGVYGKHTNPHYGRGETITAQAVRMFYVFRKFAHNYLQTMYDLGVNKRDAKAAAFMAISPAILAGAGASVLTPVLRAIGKAFGWDDPEEEYYAWLRRSMGAYAERFGRFGVFGMPEHGVSFKGSLAIGITDLPTTVIDLLGAPGSIVSDLWTGSGKIVRGQVWKGIEKAAPTSIGGIMRGYREYREGLTTGSGAPVFHGTKPVSLDLIEALYRGLGFNPSRIAAIKEEKWNEQQVATKYSEDRSDIYNEIRKFYTLPREEQTKAKFAKIVTEIEEYNARVKSRGREGEIPYLTAKAIKANMKKSFNPSKREMYREVKRSQE